MFYDDMGQPVDAIDGFVFVNKRNNMLADCVVRYTINAVVESYNAEHKDCQLEYFNPHRTRHTFTTVAYDAGVDVKYTSQILGQNPKNPNIIANFVTKFVTKFVTRTN